MICYHFIHEQVKTREIKLVEYVSTDLQLWTDYYIYKWDKVGSETESGV